MAEVERRPAPGMIALRGELGSPALCAALEGLGLAVPDRLRLAGGLDRGAAWMSPDELLLFLPRDEMAGALARLAEALAAEHYLAADVSDMRALIRVAPPAREVLAKLAPVDLHPAALPAGMFRRTRLGQVAAAFWLDADGAAHVLCLRSVADYAERLLAQSAADGAVGIF
jgi:sarcosine oxidase subunit gamma